MVTVKLKNNEQFSCEKEVSILEGARKNGIYLEHSCLAARCRSCIAKVKKGEFVEIHEEMVLSDEEKKEGYILTCNTKPLSNIEIDINSIDANLLIEPRTLPAKIDSIHHITDSVLHVVLRLPPNSSFKFIPGQYVNIIKGSIKRSYSIANIVSNNSKLEFYIKNYENGMMSAYWFKKAKQNDLLRIEGPKGSFFYKEQQIQNIVFLATGTGIAPIKSMLEEFNIEFEKYKDKQIWLFWGGRYMEDIFWEPKFKNLSINFVPVLSRQKNNWDGDKGYVQDIVLEQKINLNNAQVYACGSIDMITSAKLLFRENGLPELQFYADAFVSSN